MAGRSFPHSCTTVALVVCLGIGIQLVLSSCSDAALRKAPYLVYRGVNTQMQVLWQLDSAEVCTIQWGSDQSYSGGSAQTYEYGPDHQHAYVISNLAPGTICCYRVLWSGGERAGTFRAAPADDATNVKFIAYGDTRSYPAQHDSVAARIVAHYTADPDLQTFALSVGDLVYNGDLETDWDSQFFSPLYPNIRALLAGLPYQSAMGNHERTGVGFVKYFPYPFTAGRYWSFDYGPAHFAVVDQYTSYIPGSDQLLWLENDLASTAKPWRFVYLHEPGWSAGGGHSNETDVQTYIQPLCETYCVAAVFGGHNHYYARASVDGVEHLTVGGGGAPLHTPNLTYPYVATATRSYSHCEVAIEGDSLTLTAYTHTDSLIDSLGLSLPGAGIASWQGEVVPEVLTLGPAEPNPFSRTTKIWLEAPSGLHADLGVYAADGRRVATLLDGYLGPGRRGVVWDRRDAHGRCTSPGVYFLRLEAGGRVLTAKTVVLD